MLQLRAELGANAAHVDVHGAAAAVVVEAPHAAQQGIAAVRAARMGDQKASSAYSRYVKSSGSPPTVTWYVARLMVMLSTVTKSVEVLLPGHRSWRMRAAHSLAGAVHHEIAFHLHGKAELGKLRPLTMTSSDAEPSSSSTDSTCDKVASASARAS